ncbi:MAG TPA: hypothetical protein VMU34_23205 [Mycobacterium sp.]|nr:hypothetical protein [Mycobacterium sp.]
MTAQLEAVPVPVMGNADMEQAEYFCRLLDGMKSQVCRQLGARLDELATFQRTGDLLGVRRHQQVVKALDSERETLDRILVALWVRLGLSTRREGQSSRSG